MGEETPERVTGCWLLVAGYGLLVTGCWFRVTGYRLLVTGCWLLVAGCGLAGQREKGAKRSLQNKGEKQYRQTNRLFFHIEANI